MTARSGVASGARGRRFKSRRARQREQGEPVNPGLRLLAPGERRGWTPSDAEIQRQRNPHDWDAFPDYVDALRQETMNYSGQVVLVHGDSHSGDFLKSHRHGKVGKGSGVLGCNGTSAQAEPNRPRQ
jgi:hypothetical protein